MIRKRKIDNLYSGTVTELLKDKSLELSFSDLDKLIDDELEKEEDMNPDLIEFYIDTINEMRNTGNISITIAEKEGNSNRISFKGIKKIIAVVAAMFLLACVTLSAYAAVFKVNLLDEFVEFYTEHIVIRFDKSNGKAEKYELLGSDLAQKLKENNIFPVMLPEILLSDEAQIISVSCEKTDAFILANISFEVNEKKGSLFLTQYDNTEEMPKVTFPEAENVTCIDVKGVPLFVFSQNKESRIVYQEGNSQYTIVVSDNLGNAIEIAKTIK